MAGWFKKSESINYKDQFLAIDRQVKAWRKANSKMKWGISDLELHRLPQAPELNNKDLDDGFCGVVLSYGFGNDGSGNADSVLSGKLTWDFAKKRIFLKTWQCQYIDFSKTDHFRLRPGAPARPRGSAVMTPLDSASAMLTRIIPSLVFLCFDFKHIFLKSL